MLTSPKQPALMQAQPTHVDLFVENYDLLKRWALQFTEHDRELAEDLLHDAFIQFTLSKPDLDSIQNLEGYLFIVMRNLHLSQLRRATRTPLRSLSVVEYDTADVSFWASDPRDRIRMRDEIGAVCQYACIRKESSKAGSVLILRFFHGYYPEEIASVVRSNRSAVEKRLQMARAEVRLYLEDPDRLGFIGDKPSGTKKLTVNHFGDDLRLELRRQIFNSRQGECLVEETLHDLYTNAPAENSIDHRLVAHIVSCQTCLESVNSLLGLPPLAQRYPLDTIGKDPGKKGGSGGGGGSTGGGTGGSKMLDSYFNRREAHFHHQPQELCVSVNGQLQGFQKVISGKGELTLIIDTTENLGFVEVFSEQGLRLLMLNVEPPPAGDGKQSAHMELSEGRTIDANLNFSGTHPALQVTYNDPRLASEAATSETSDVPGMVSVEAIETIPTIPFDKKEPRLKSLFDGWRSWLQPARLTTAFAAILIVALLIFKFAPLGTVSAAELLNRSAEAEATQLANKDRVLHRTLDLEESDVNGQPIAHRKIDIWQSAEKGITARRLYDEQGRLTMGDWRLSSGIQTIYTRGQAARLQPLPDVGTKPISFDDAWQLSVSAKEFIALLGQTTDAQVETRANDYLITYTLHAGGKGVGITRATIILSRDDLHAIEEAFTLQSGGETRQFRFVETSYEWKPASVVAPAVFEPNVELTGTATTRPAGLSEPEVSTTGLPENANTSANTGPSATLATAALEVEIVEALNNAGAFMGEQVSVNRTADGKISVTGLVETPERKKALLNALSSHRNDPAVRINIETVAEAEKRVKSKRNNQSQGASPTTVEVTASEGTSPVQADLKKKFSDDEARRFSDRVLARTRQVWLHAAAMKQISQRFSPADLASLPPAERGRWLALIRSHAASFVREGEALSRELAQVFPEAAAPGGNGGAISTDADLQAKVRELYEASVALDSGMDRSFGLGASGSPPVKSPAFWRSFSNALGVARSLQSVR
jgi:RNA polymerase sigma factor (sigma-70 family)